MPNEWLEALRPLGTDWRKPHVEDAPYVVVVFEQAFGVRARRHEGQALLRQGVGLHCRRAHACVPARGWSRDVDAHAEPDWLSARDPGSTGQSAAVRARIRPGIRRTTVSCPISSGNRCTRLSSGARRSRARACRASTRSRGGSTRRSPAPPRSGHDEGELHDADVVVAIAVTARVGSSLIEGPKAVALPLSPHVLGTLIRRARPRNPQPRRGVQFATKMRSIV